MEIKTGTIKQKAIINAMPEEVYNAFMNARIHSEFTESKATVVPRVGGRITAWDGYITGRNLELVKGKRIVQEWRTTDWPKGYPPSLLTITLKKKGGKTELTMVHSKVPREGLDDYADGWKEYYWKKLNAYFKSKNGS